MVRTYSRGEVEQLLGALDGSASAVIKTAGLASAVARRDKFACPQMPEYGPNLPRSSAFSPRGAARILTGYTV